MAARRDNELKAALALLGAGEIGEPARVSDRYVALHEEDLVGELYEVFNGQQQRFASCLVALPWRGDPHADHRAAGRAGVRAAVLSGLGAVETPIWGWYHLSGDGASRARACAGSRSAPKPVTPNKPPSAASGASSNCYPAHEARYFRRTSPTHSRATTR